MTPRLPAFICILVGIRVDAIAATRSALNPAGDQASRISDLWWFYLAVLVGVFTLVCAALLTAVVLHARRRNQAQADGPLLTPDPARERKLTNVVLASVVATVAILFILLFADMFAGRAISSPAPADAITINLTGHQWWWSVTYEDPVPSKIVSTANEIHIPAGRPVLFKLQSTDVIHSFWVPNLHGKKDLIPGHPTSTWFVARHPGTYRGQCAEFCGHQHAHMGLTIVVQKPDEFAKWLDHQRQSAPPPTNEQELRGQRLFLGGTCVMCHRIQGTPARASVGPDLTHVASRQKIAAGTLPVKKETLSRWISDPHVYKPGVRMPQHTFARDELDALVAYLMTLK